MADKKVEVIAKRLKRAGLEMREGRIVAVCSECGQEVSVANRPLPGAAQKKTAVAAVVSRPPEKELTTA